MRSVVWACFIAEVALCVWSALHGDGYLAMWQAVAAAWNFAYIAAKYAALASRPTPEK